MVTTPQPSSVPLAGERGPEPSEGAQRREGGKAGSADAGATTRFSGLAWALAVALACSLLTIPVLDLRHARFDMPWHYVSDGVFTLMMIKSSLRDGWWYTSDMLGAPYGMRMYDFPVFAADSLQFAMIRVLGAVLPIGHAGVMNTYFLLSFPAIGVAMFAVLRLLGIMAPVAAATAVLFAFAPYHLSSGEGQLMLSWYVSVPFVVLVAMRVARGQQIWTRRRHDGPVARRWLSGTTLATAGTAVLVGTTGIYYSMMGSLIILAVGLAAAIAHGAWRPFARATIFVGLVGVVVGSQLVPTMLQRHAEGPNGAVALRSPHESQRWGLEMASLLMPVPGHPIDALAEARHEFDSVSLLRTGSQHQALGIFASVGFVALIIVVLAGTIGGGRLGGRGDDRLRAAAVIAAVAFGIATVGGVSTLIAFNVTPQFRGWARMSIYISCVSMVAAAILLDGGLRRVVAGRGRVPAAAILGGACALVVAVGMLDQASRVYVPDYAALEGEWHRDATFIAQVERELPAGAMVLQLPFVRYPESAPVGQMQDYDLGRAYLHSDDLRWSYGAVKGRDHDDLPRQLADVPASQLPAAAEGKGYSGIYIDRLGFPARAAALERELAAVLGPPEAVSVDARLAFYELPDA